MENAPARVGCSAFYYCFVRVRSFLCANPEARRQKAIVCGAAVRWMQVRFRVQKTMRSR